VSELNFELIAGSADSAVILHIPHSSRVIPADTRQDLLFSDEELERELDEITDTLTDLVAMESLKKLDSKTPLPWLFINRLSRLVIDPERFPDDREVMNKVGMGAVYSKGTSGEQLRAADFNSGDLLERYFHPYSIALSNLVSERLSKTGYALIIDVHSYRPQQHPNAINYGQMRPSICMGTDKFHTPDWLKTLFLKEFKVLGECLENQPYSGSYIPLEFFERDERVWSVMLEARSDTFLDYALKPHQGLAEISGALARFISSAQASAL